MNPQWGLVKGLDFSSFMQKHSAKHGPELDLLLLTVEEGTK